MFTKPHCDISSPGSDVTFSVGTVHTHIDDKEKPDFVIEAFGGHIALLR